MDHRLIAIAGVIAVSVAVAGGAAIPSWGDAFVAGTGVLFGVVLLRHMLAGPTPARPTAVGEVLRRTARPSGRPEDLRRLENLFGWGRYEAREFEYRIRPVLLEVAGSALHRQGDPSGSTLPADVRALLFEPRGEDAGPVTNEMISRVVEHLEER